MNEMGISMAKPSMLAEMLASSSKWNDSASCIAFKDAFRMSWIESVSGNGIALVMIDAGTGVSVGSGVGVGSGVAVGSGVGEGIGVAVGSGVAVSVGARSSARDAPGWAQAANSSVTSDISRNRSAFCIFIS